MKNALHCTTGALRSRAGLASALVLVLVVACDMNPSAECEVIASRMGYLNGSNLNGSNLNGINIGNGSNLNGRYLGNGVSIQGVSLQGIQLQGVDPGGLIFTDGRLASVDLAGRVLEGEDLVGATLPARLDDGETIELEIVAADDNRFALAHEGVNICGEGEMGIFVPGTWDETGAHADSVAGAPEFAATFSCETGVVAKCVAWGYAPWDVGTDVHQACTRMARADYCGDGVSYTRDGTLIDVADALGVQQYSEEPDLEREFEFEAGWGPDGAVCAARPRYDESVVGEGEVLPDCWEALPACDNAEQAYARGATFVNRSRPQERLLCRAR